MKKNVTIPCSFSTDEGNDIRHKRKGFTLIELLVIMSVISILSVMLLTALNKVKLTTQGIDCTNNLRQIGQASLTYWGDLKIINTPVGTPKTNFGLGMFKVLSQEEYLDIRRPQDGEMTYYVNQGGSMIYHENAKIFTCPTQALNTMHVARHYGYNAYLQRRSVGMPFWGRLTRIKYPSETMHWVDTDGHHTLAYREFHGNNTKVIIDGARHSGKNNIAFVDGHISRQNAYENIQTLDTGE